MTSGWAEREVAARPSPAAQQRLRRLLDARASQVLSVEEEAELNDALAGEHFMRRLKVRASAIPVFNE